MGGKKLFMSNMLLLAMLLVAFIAATASARDPFVGLPLGGKRLGNSLACCNDCRCSSSLGYSCVCYDKSTLECTPGCSRCRCDLTSFPPCRCADTLDSCPDLCYFASS